MAFTKINAAGIGTTETVTVDGLTVINDGSFGGNLTVSGVLTYEDVTNVDSVGLITARNGIVVGSGITLSKDGDIFATGITTVSGNVKVGTGITLSPDGDVFFTGVGTGNGSGLTALNASNLASGTVPTARLGSGTASSSTFLRGDSTFAAVTSTTINNNADNRVITGSGTANTLNGESSLTFDGSKLVIANTSSTDANNSTDGAGFTSGTFHHRSRGDSAGISGQTYSNQLISSNGTNVALEMYTIGATGTPIVFGTNSTERLRIDTSGNLATGGVASPASSDTGNIYIKAASTVGSNGTGLNLVSNARFDSGWKHIATGAASYLQLNANGHLIYSTEASASAGASATFDRVFRVGIDGGTILNGGLGFSGNLSITDAMAKVQIMGAVHTAFTRANSYLHIGGTESHSSPGMLQTISFGHVKTSTTHAPAYIGLLTTDRNAQEKGQIEIATRDVTTDTMPTPSLIVRPSKSIVRRGPDYANYIVSMQTVNGGGTARNVQVLEDCYGQWLVVAKITSTDEFKGTMASTAQMDVTNDQVTGDPQWSSLFGDTYPSEIRYIQASDWEYWRETRNLDFIHGVPDDRKYKHFFTNGEDNSMGIIADNKRGWKCAGCYDGFGRWRNPFFTNHKMADNNANGQASNNPIITSAFFTTAGSTMNWHNGNYDAKIIASHDQTTDGQDDEWTTGWGWDDNGLINSDEFPNKGNNSTGTDMTGYNLWICIKLSSPTFGHD